MSKDGLIAIGTRWVVLSVNTYKAYEAIKKAGFDAVDSLKMIPSEEHAEKQQQKVIDRLAKETKINVKNFVHEYDTLTSSGSF